MSLVATPLELRVLVVDDEPFAREKIVKFLSKETQIAWVGEAGDGLAATAMITEYRPDVVFLDIEMPERSGFEVIKHIPAEHMPLIVFVTAFDEFAVDAFQNHALDYLLKPYDHTRFSQALGRVRERLKLGRAWEYAQTAMAWMNQWQNRADYSKRLVVQKPNRAYFLQCQDVFWLKADGRHAQCRALGELHPLKESLASLEKKLDPKNFHRIHRGYIVNLDQVKEVQNWFWGTYLLIMQDGSQIQTGRTYREKVMQLLKI